MNPVVIGTLKQHALGQDEILVKIPQTTCTR